MDYPVLLYIELTGLILFFCLPYIAYRIYRYTDLITFVIFLILFWAVTGFTTFLATARWAIVLGY